MTPVPWPTPTPFPQGTLTAPPLEFGDGAKNIAENLVQGYNSLLTLDAFTVLMWLMIVVLLIGGLWSLNKHLKKI